MRLLSTLILIAVLVSIPARATNFTYSTTISTGTTVTGKSEYIYALGASQSAFQVATGDTISGTITFGDPLSFQFPASKYTNVDYIYLQFENTTGTTTNGSLSTVQLLGVTGPLASNNPQTGTDLGSGLTAVYQGSPHFDESATNVIITGLSYSLTAHSESTSGLSYLPEDLIIIVAPDEMTVIPEPSTTSLLLWSLFGAIVFSLRFRRQFVRLRA